MAVYCFCEMEMLPHCVCWLHTMYNIDGLGAHTQSYPRSFEHDWLQPNHLLIQACCQYLVGWLGGLDFSVTFD
jgi:hypothetical protein